MLDAHSNNCWPGWETTRLIGRGSFGAVYEIERKLFEDDVDTEKAALKVISIPQNDSDIEELYSDGYDEESVTNTFHVHLKNIVAEYSLMRKMNGSSNIVNCDDVRYVQHEDGIGWDIFIKMELLTPLAKALPATVSEEEVVRIATDMCAALELCQKHNIIHRDIKPQNIFVSENGDYKLGDFGIAKTVEKTMGGTKTGTYKYMAPEVYNNQPYNSTADIYSLGLVLYWLLNERRMPFMPLPPEKLTVGMDEKSRNRRLSGETISAPKNGSSALKQIVLKACEFDPKDRYQTAQEMREVLARLSGENESAFQSEVLHSHEADLDNDETVGVNYTQASNIESEKTVGVDYTQASNIESEKTVGVDYTQASNIESEKTVGVDYTQASNIESEKTVGVDYTQASNIELEKTVGVDFTQTSNIELEKTVGVDYTQTSDIELEKTVGVDFTQTSNAELEKTVGPVFLAKAEGDMSSAKEQEPAQKTKTSTQKTKPILLILVAVCVVATLIALSFIGKDNTKILGLEMTLEEFEQQSAQLFVAASRWTRETAPRSLNDFPLFPDSLFELVETVQRTEEEITIRDSMLTWSPELSKILPETKTGLKYLYSFDYYDYNQDEWVSIPLEMVEQNRYAVQLPEDVWGGYNRNFELSIYGYNDFDEWNLAFWVRYPISGKQIKPASAVNLMMNNNQSSVMWGCSDQTIDIDLSLPNGQFWALQYDATSGKLLHMNEW